MERLPVFLVVIPLSRFDPTITNPRGLLIRSIVLLLSPEETRLPGPPSPLVPIRPSASPTANELLLLTPVFVLVVTPLVRAIGSELNAVKCLENAPGSAFLISDVSRLGDTTAP